MSMMDRLSAMKIHHIGYLVRHIEKSKIIFQNMGYEIEQDTVYDEFRQIEICFLIKDGYRIELVESKTKDSVVSDLRARIGNSPYHICYEVENLDEAIKELETLRFVVCQEPHEAVAIDGRCVAFMLHGQIGMIELLEV